MSEQAGRASVSSGAKKAIVLFIMIAAAALLLFYLFSPKQPQGPAVINVGDVGPQFSLRSLDGKQVTLSDFRGKIAIVHFWATWCPPCVEEIPTIDKLYRTLPGADFALLAVSVDEGGEQAVRSFLERKRLTLPVLLDTDHAVAGSYGTFKFPETYIIDRKGVVAYKVIGPADWTNPETIKALQELAAR